MRTYDAWKTRSPDDERPEWEEITEAMEETMTPNEYKDLPEQEPLMRTFASGATRSADATKPDYEGFLSPLTLVAFGRYMTKHRRQADGSLRDSDNWQKGIPVDSYMKSLLRHVMTLWLHHRGYGELADECLDDALAGVMFNANGLTHEHEKSKLATSQP